MGTSQAIKPSVKGNKDLSNLSSSISRASSTPSPSNEQLGKLMGHFSNLVNAGRSGGSGVGFGGAGPRTIGKLLSFIDAVSSSGGVTEVLEQKGYLLPDNATANDIINFLIKECTPGNSTLDETAARSANDIILEELFNEIEDADEIEDILNGFDEQKAEDLICGFFTSYIVEYSAQLFEERILNKVDGEEKIRIFEQIKFYISEEVSQSGINMKLTRNDWSSTETEKLLSKIQQDILEVFE